MSELAWRTEVTVYHLPDTQEAYWFVYAHHSPPAHSPAARQVLRHKGDRYWSFWVPRLHVIRAVKAWEQTVMDGTILILSGHKNGHTGEVLNYPFSPIARTQFVPAMIAILDLTDQTVIAPGTGVRFYREPSSDTWLNAETHPPAPHIPPPLFPSKKRRRRRR